MTNEVALGMGTKLEFKDGEIWTEVARLNTIGEFDLGDIDDVTATTYDSPDNFKEYVPGLSDAGEVEITGIWIADASQVSLADIRSRVNDWRVILPKNLGTFEFKGYLKGPRITPALEDKITFAATIKITGKPTFTVE